MQLLNFVPSHTTFFLFSIQTRNMTVCYCIHYPELYLTQVVALCHSYVIYRTELLYSLKYKNLVWIAYLAIFQPFELGNEELKSIEIFFYMLYVVRGGSLALNLFDFMTSKFFPHFEHLTLQKYVCHCCQRLCFDFQVCQASTSHFKTISPLFENLNLDN
jgi:hypothetical protein